MILAGHLIRKGGLIAYCADAKVIHSHNYSALQQFHRNFDLAVSQTMHPEIFGGIRSESEGIRLVKMSMKHCLQIGKPWLCFQVLSQSAGKYLGYKLGQRYGQLPRKMILWCTMNPHSGRRNEDEKKIRGSAGMCMCIGDRRMRKRSGNTGTADDASEPGYGTGAFRRL